MPQFQFPLSSGELKLAVLIGHNSKALMALRARGQALPAPIWTTGVVDTGTNATCVTPAVFQRLGIAFTGQGSSQTTGGQVAVNLIGVSLSIPPPGNVPGPILTRPNPTVMEMPSPIPGIEVLIGMDIHLDCKLFLDGPARQFMLEF